MPKYRLTRILPRRGANAGTAQQKIAEIAEGQTLPMGAVLLDDQDTATTDWANASQSPTPEETP